MSITETMIIIFVFGLAMSFLVAKGIWEARDFKKKVLEGAMARASSPAKLRPIRDDIFIT